MLLDEKLRSLGIDSRDIAGYNQEETSHLAVANSVARGEADVGLGIEKAALQVREIDFISSRKNVTTWSSANKTPPNRISRQYLRCCARRPSATK